MIVLHPCWSDSIADSHAVVASKENQDPDELRGVKILLFGLLFGFSILAKARSQMR